MKEQFFAALTEALEGHHGAAVGTILGALLAIAILCFGFWRTAFVVCIALVGLYIGREEDDGVDVFGKISDNVLNALNRFQHRNDSFRNRRDLW